ncbi:hypothetical protein BD410DRAFT_771148 [Rickenella mellea]|uniref:CBM1 domain-containing protein n=1 Tax=Rickenella mellea TaxID=50990 RepID=A0A4Y7Q2D1_9AGAM|nr:hypothetical protein BD410DRAFT_771148 [Rickenella mellea]
MLAQIGVFLAVLACVSAQATAPEWGQCGGIGWTGPTACPPGWTCVYANPYHSQCLQVATTSSTPMPPTTTSTKPPTTSVKPSTTTSIKPSTSTKSSTSTSTKPSSSTTTSIKPSTTTTTTTTPPPPPATSSPVTAPEWGQCGGIGWTGPTTCPPGWFCTYLNAYHSQCLVPATTTTEPTTTSDPPTPTATAGPLGATLLPGNFWVYSDEAPNFQWYLQSSVSGAASPAVVGDSTTAAQFQLVNGQVVQQLGAGNVLYLNVDTSGVASGATYIPTFFAATPNPNGTFGFQGNGLTWTSAGISRPFLGAFLACETPGYPAIYINLGAYGYNTPLGCSDETLNSYYGATADSVSWNR